MVFKIFYCETNIFYSVRKTSHFIAAYDTKDWKNRGEQLNIHNWNKNAFATLKAIDIQTIAHLNVYAVVKLLNYFQQQTFVDHKKQYHCVYQCSNNMAILKKW